MVKLKCLDLLGFKVTTMINELALSMFNMTITDAHKNGVCIKCKNQAFVDDLDGNKQYTEGMFYSPSGKHEYMISGLCENCFDNMLGGSE